MSLDPATFPPAQAWAPLKYTEWNEDNARHLLHRIGFSATPDRVAQATKLGLSGTLTEAFDKVQPMPMPDSVADYIAKRADLQASIRSANQANDGPGRQQFVMELNQVERQAFLDYVQAWLAFARQPANSAQENLVMFLGNVFVVAQAKVKEPDVLFQHADLLRNSWQDSYPNICKAVTFSPAMIQYLDLNTSVRGVPNENFARELMELFTLGQGNYSENDIKEAARAFTGIVIRDGAGVFARQRWDPGNKTIYGQTGPWGATDVVDLIFAQPAARTHLPRRFLTYFLSQDPLPAPYLDELGSQWQAHNFRVADLARIVFSSQLFYQPQFRRALIKSPIQYYLGLCQDLELDVSPFEGLVFQQLRSMGQEPFNPPNVRGWLTGKNWINSSTLAARRQLVQQMFNPNFENNLTADMKMKLDAAREAGRGDIAMSNDRLQTLSQQTNENIADQLLNYFLTGEATTAYRGDIIDYMENDLGPRPQLVGDVAAALFQSPEYHLC